VKLYVVGGAVRDRLLGLPAADRDWVAVGATPEQLVAAGYRPVGQDFPVFLHPVTHEEVALARVALVAQKEEPPSCFIDHALVGVVHDPLPRRQGPAQAAIGVMHSEVSEARALTRPHKPTIPQRHEGPMQVDPRGSAFD
jgi:hypothetical protein